MSLIYITGPTGAGKTTVGEALRLRGYEVHDTDDEGWRFWCNKKTGAPVDGPKKTALEDLQWHEDHIYTLASEPVQELFAKAKDKTIFLCGTTQSDLNFKEVFSKIILLVIDEATQGHRITHRTNHSYGKQPHQYATALRWREPQILKYSAAGAYKIDATKQVDDIVEEILTVIK